MGVVDWRGGMGLGVGEGVQVDTPGFIWGSPLAESSVDKAANRRRLTLDDIV